MVAAKGYLEIFHIQKLIDRLLVKRRKLSAIAISYIHQEYELKIMWNKVWGDTDGDIDHDIIAKCDNALKYFHAEIIILYNYDRRYDGELASISTYDGGVEITYSWLCEMRRFIDHDAMFLFAARINYLCRYREWWFGMAGNENASRFAQ